MPEDNTSERSTLALSTKLEEDFVAPLAAMRGSLEILRDFPDLTPAERERFVNAALAECARLGKGVEHLASSVYAAGRRGHEDADEEPSHDAREGYAARVTVLEDGDVLEVDLSGLEFSSSKVVNDFYDVLEQTVVASGRTPYLLVNYRDCSIWPEAWVAFAHRAKRMRVNHSLGTARYVDDGTAAGVQEPGSDMFGSRALALEHVHALRRGAGSSVRRNLRAR